MKPVPIGKAGLTRKQRSEKRKAKRQSAFLRRFERYFARAEAVAKEARAIRNE